MVFSSSLSASSLLSANIRQDVSLVFVGSEQIQYSFKNIKKYIYALVAMISFSALLPGTSYASTVGETKEFIVTAYYSPLPDQSWYFKGNYQAEVKLNGNGTHGASGRPVYTGMIAAPKSYNFGTKIYFEGLGIGVVEDRGGAIVTAGERGQSYDRIDIWMGHGEAGLKRALLWGRRKVTGVFVESSATGSMIDLSGIDSGKIDLSQFEKVVTITNGILPTDILQKFADLGYTTEGRTTKDMIIAFQLDHGIISDVSDPGSGNYGPMTTMKLSEEHKRYTALKDNETRRIERERAELLDQHAEWGNLITRAESEVTRFGNPARGEKGEHIKKLQDVLLAGGYLKGKATGTMNPATLLALKNLQRKNGLAITGKIDIETRFLLIETMIEKQFIV